MMASKDKIYIVMEFMPGGELFDKIVAEGPLEVGLSPGSSLCMHKTGQARAWPSRVTVAQSSAGCAGRAAGASSAEPAGLCGFARFDLL